MSSSVDSSACSPQDHSSCAKSADFELPPCGESCVMNMQPDIASLTYIWSLTNIRLSDEQDRHDSPIVDCNGVVVPVQAMDEGLD